MVGFDRVGGTVPFGSGVGGESLVVECCVVGVVAEFVAFVILCQPCSAAPEWRVPGCRTRVTAWPRPLGMLVVPLPSLSRLPVAAVCLLIGAVYGVKVRSVLGTHGVLRVMESRLPFGLMTSDSR